MPERADPVLPHRVGDGTEHTERRYPHDQAHGAEQHRGDRVDQGGHLFALLAADERQGDAEDNGEEQHLKHVVAR